MRKQLIAALMLMGMTATAQTITFDTDDYLSIGVYDTWEESPFRTGLLKGNVGVMPNVLRPSGTTTTASPNESSRILAIQRSRFGSNTFGARIDLRQPFGLSPTERYVHVMIHKPTSGRVMLVGLGKRRERLGQSKDAEQFWSLATTKVVANTWSDAVFAIKGAEGVDIHALVVVPDCESPHNQTSDYLCYIDEIVVDDNPQPRFHVSTDYELNFDPLATNPRNDRRLTAIGISTAGHHVQTIQVKDARRLYNDLTSTALYAAPGDTITPTFTYSGTWMNGYVYADWDNNGRFETEADASTATAKGSNICSYAYYSTQGGVGTNSLGAIVAQGNVLNPPPFVIPADVAYGLYRMRFKVDWNSLDPAGNTTTNNHIAGNGGAIVDVMVNIHADVCHVNDANRNGEVLSATDGAKLVGYKTAFGRPFTIRMNPERGFVYSGIRVRHGYGLAGDSLVHGNAQYRDTIFSHTLFHNDEFTIPAECMDGDVEIEGLFVEKKMMQADGKKERRGRRNKR